MAQLKYAVDKDQKRFRMYFDTKNPVENGLAQMFLVSLKPYAYKVPGTNLLCMEIALSDNMISEYLKYIQEIEIAEAKRRPKSSPKSSKVSKRKPKKTP